jgi:hypothetical protein
MRFFLCTSLAALLLPLSARSEVLGEIHCQYRDGLIWLKVDVSGKSEALNFLLDSGAGISAIDSPIFNLQKKKKLAKVSKCVKGGVA